MDVLLIVTYFTSRSVKPWGTAAVKSIHSICTGSVALTGMTGAVINICFRREYLQEIKADDVMFHEARSINKKMTRLPYSAAITLSIYSKI